MGRKTALVISDALTTRRFAAGVRQDIEPIVDLKKNPALAEHAHARENLRLCPMRGAI